MDNRRRSVLVTGAAAGIGRSLALGLRDRGFAVFSGARRDDDLAALAQAGMHPLRIELSDSTNIQDAARTMLGETGGELWGLVNNAAYGQPGAVEDLTRDALRRQFEVNVFGTHELTAALLPAMRRRNAGRIVQISSILGLVSLPYRGAYNASKYALEALSDALRLETAGTGIRVSLIEPGAIESRFRATALEQLRGLAVPAHSPHAEAYRRLARQAETVRPIPFVRPPEAVLAAVAHALEHRRPKTRYRVGPHAHALAVMKRLLPDRLLDRIVLAISAR
jgi:NAD(P)-dependent dehydrogenase (short-subunit alcohol dehydrogenase family)